MWLPLFAHTTRQAQVTPGFIREGACKGCYTEDMVMRAM